MRSDSSVFKAAFVALVILVGILAVLFNVSMSRAESNIAAIKTQYAQLSDYVRVQDAKLDYLRSERDRHDTLIAALRKDLSEVMKRRPDSRWILNRFELIERRMGVQERKTR